MASTSAPPPYPTESKSYPPQPQSFNYPHEKSGYVGVPQSDPGVSGQPSVVIVQQPLMITRQRESFVKQIILSCVVTWLCCWPLGLVAFILAMVANSTAEAVDENSAQKAHSLGVHSCRTSIAGIIIGVIIFVIWIILVVINAAYKYEDNPK